MAIQMRDRDDDSPFGRPENESASHEHSSPAALGTRRGSGKIIKGTSNLSTASP
jgi:hypothetical protein